MLSTVIEFCDDGTMYAMMPMADGEAADEEKEMRDGLAVVETCE